MPLGPVCGRLELTDIRVTGSPLDLTHSTQGHFQASAFGEAARDVCPLFLLEPRANVFQAK